MRLHGTRGGAFGWDTTLQAGRTRVRLPVVSLEFFIDIILWAALYFWGRLSLKQKWAPRIFPGDKSGRCVGLTTLSPYISLMYTNVAVTIYTTVYRWTVTRAVPAWD
jgi:hypothetical protein